MIFTGCDIFECVLLVVISSQCWGRLVLQRELVRTGCGNGLRVQLLPSREPKFSDVELAAQDVLFYESRNPLPEKRNEAWASPVGMVANLTQAAP
jgi:hypothetical protein